MLSLCLACHFLTLAAAVPHDKVAVLHTTNADSAAPLATTIRLSVNSLNPGSYLGPTLMSAATTLMAPGEVAPGACQTYAILSARGTSESQINPAGSRGLISAVLATVPHGESYEVVYPASINLITDPETGAVDLMQHLGAMLQKCPAQKIIFFGYCEIDPFI